MITLKMKTIMLMLWRLDIPISNIFFSKCMFQLNFEDTDLELITREPPVETTTTTTLKPTLPSLKLPMSLGMKPVDWIIIISVFKMISQRLNL